MNEHSRQPPEPPAPSWGLPDTAAAIAGAATAHGAAATAPASRGRGLLTSRRRTAPVTAHVAPRTRSRNRWLIPAAIAALVFIGPMVMSAVSGNRSSFSGAGGSGGSSSGRSGVASSITGSDDNWSNYYNENLDGNSYSSRWQRDSTFHGESTQVYDGPYDYSGYGVDGMKRRAKGSAADPLYSQSAALPDVFDQYGVGADPLGGAPATARAGTPDPVNPYYDPWAATYQNPYQNRLDLTFGSASSRSAWLDDTNLGTP